MSWGKGGMVGVNKAIWQHELAMKVAAQILERECGDRHATGSRTDLCPKCQTQARHVCGAQGFDPFKGDVCPGCSPVGTQTAGRGNSSKETNG